MNIKTARALRDLLSIIIAVCKEKKLEDVIEIKIDRSGDGLLQQYIIIRFKREVN